MISPKQTKDRLSKIKANKIEQESKDRKAKSDAASALILLLGVAVLASSKPKKKWYQF